MAKARLRFTFELSINSLALSHSVTQRQPQQPLTRRSYFHTDLFLPNAFRIIVTMRWLAGWRA